MTTLLDAQVSLNEVIDAMHEALEAVARKATKDDHPYTVARQVTQDMYARLVKKADDYVPQPTRAEAERMMSDLSGVNSVCRGTPPEETKPPARAHLKGCSLDTDHSGLCFVPMHPPADAEMQAKVDAAYAKASTALSPRQALGEALACLERAATLLQTPGMPDDGQRDGRTATGYTRDAISRARLIRKAAGWS